MSTQRDVPAGKVIAVTADLDKDDVEIEPEQVFCGSWADAFDMVRRALEMGATVLVALEVGDANQCDEPDLDDWPSPRHVKRWVPNADGLMELEP